MRRLTLQTTTTQSWAPLGVTMASTFQQTRKNHIYFSCQNPKLERVQAEKGFASDLWVGANHLKHLNLRVASEHFQKITVAEVKQQRVIVNLDDVDASATLQDGGKSVLQDKMELKSRFPELVKEHTNMLTGKAYHETWHFQLTDRQVINGYSSKWWADPFKLTGAGYRLAKGARTHRIAPITPEKMYNCSQLTPVSQEILLRLPFSGGNGKMSLSDELKAVMKKKKYSTGVFFTLPMSKRLGLGLNQDRDVRVEKNSEKFDPNVIYNLSDFKDWRKLVSKAEQFKIAKKQERPGYKMDLNPAEPQFLQNGPVTSDRAKYLLNILNCTHEDVAKGYTVTRPGGSELLRKPQPLWPVNVFLNFQEMRDYNLLAKGQLNPKAVKVPQAYATEEQVEREGWINLDEFEDVAKAKLKMGTLTSMD